jgi:hypothetical protein
MHVSIWLYHSLGSLARNPHCQKEKKRKEKKKKEEVAQKEQKSNFFP